MGNPSIRRHEPVAAPADAGNGILARIPSDTIAAGSQTLPQAGRDLKGQRRVVPLVGIANNVYSARITYECWGYKHGRSWHWAWKAVRADGPARPETSEDARRSQRQGLDTEPIWF